MKEASQQVSESASLRGRTRHFRDLTAWQKSMSLARAIDAATAAFPKAEQFGLVSQMRRCAVSVPSNIAEGHGRLTDKGFRVFLAQSRGSVFELETQLQLSSDLTYLSGPGREESDRPIQRGRPHSEWTAESAWRR